MKKKNRLLYIYDRLEAGYTVNVQDLATCFHVSKRTILRDINEIRNHYDYKLVENKAYVHVTYERIGNCETR